MEQLRKLNKLATTIETTPTQRQTNKLSFRPPLFLPPGVDPLHFRLFSNAHCCTYIPPFLFRFKYSDLKQTPTCYIIIEANLVAFPAFPTTVRFVASASTEATLLERKLFIIFCNPKLNNHCNHKQSTFAMAKIFKVSKNL